MAGYAMSKNQHLAALRRIEGQVRGLQRLIDEDTYCVDVITQISAVSRALQRVAVGLVHEHLNHCVAGAIKRGGDEATVKIDEATAAIERLLKS
jgi:DNA-binding FrmR family transcriptional regulator